MDTPSYRISLHYPQYLSIMLFTIFLGVSSLAHAIDVTTLADVVNESDGVTSLREALASIPSQNSTPVDVNLTIPGIYYLTKPLKNEVKYKSFTLKGLGASTTTISRSYNDALESMFQLYGSSGPITMDGLSITNGYSQFGGAINSNNVSSLTLRNCILSNNKSLASGGAIIFDAYSDETRILTIENCTIRNNTAGTTGGAIYTSYGTLIVNSSIFDSNNSAGSGGAIKTTNSIVAIDQTTLMNNVAIYTGYQAYGGALYVEYGHTTISNSTVFKNRVDGSGALGVAGAQQTMITNTTFAQNYSSNNGGAIYNYPGYNSSGSPLILRNVTISENQAYQGGGLYQNGSSGTILYNSIISENKASYTGNDCYGTINSEGYNLITDIENCTIKGNDDHTDQYKVSADLSAYIDFPNPGSGHYELEAESLAIDRGDPAPVDQGGTCVRPDQLGNPQSGKACDAGAIETTAIPGCSSGGNAPDTDCDGDGLSEDEGDCNDADTAMYCHASEKIDGKDNNCDGLIDDKAVVGSTTTDNDGDGYSESQGDCNDTDGTMYPGAPETGDGVDHNCNCVIDEGPSCEASTESVNRTTDSLLAAPTVSADLAKIVRAFVARNLKTAQAALVDDTKLQRDGFRLIAPWQQALQSDRSDISPLLGKTGHWLINLGLNADSTELSTLGGFLLGEAKRPITVAGFTKDLTAYLSKDSQQRGFYFLGQKLF